MKLTIINQFAAYLQSQNYAGQTIRCYVGIISDLDDPPTADCDANALYAYIDHALNQNKYVFSKSCFASFRASLNALFLMQTGIPIAEYRSRLFQPDEYDIFLQKYEKAEELSAKLIWMDSDGILLRSRCLYAVDGEDAACEYLFPELARRDHQRYLFEAAREMLSTWNLSEEHRIEFNETVNEAVNKNTFFDGILSGRTAVEELE